MRGTIYSETNYAEVCGRIARLQTSSVRTFKLVDPTHLRPKKTLCTRQEPHRIFF